MKLKKFVIAAVVAMIGWFSIPRGIKLAQAYANQQHTLKQAASLIHEVGDPNRAANLDSLKQSQKKLQDAVTVLSSIPTLPGFESERARTELAKLRPLLDAVNGRLQQEEKAAADFAAARKLDMEAGELAKGAPHPAEVWQQARDQWQQAIVLLRNIPTTSFVFDQAKKGLEACQINFKLANQQWVAETRALKQVDAAIAVAERAAKATQTQPYQLTELMNAKNQWQQSLMHLNQVDDTTTVYPDAQLLLAANQSNVRHLDDAIAQIQTCQKSYQSRGLDLDSPSWCGYEASLELETPEQVFASQIEPGAEEVESDYDDPDDPDVAIVASTHHYSRYRSRKSSSRSGWVRGYSRSDGTSVRGHSRGSGSRVSGFGSSRSGGASS
jgi:hypothetical protein